MTALFSSSLTRDTEKPSNNIFRAWRKKISINLGVFNQLYQWLSNVSVHQTGLLRPPPEFLIQEILSGMRIYFLTSTYMFHILLLQGLCLRITRLNHHTRDGKAEKREISALEQLREFCVYKPILKDLVLFFNTKETKSKRGKYRQEALL